MVARAKCAGCKQYFSKNELQTLGLQRFCSTECMWESRDRQKEKRVAKTRSRSVPRASERPNPRLPAVLRQRVRERDGHVCRWCGSNSNLQVHHVVYRSQGGRDHASNLITLCQEHHAEAHSNKRIYQPVLLATIWIHYVEGKYRMIPEVMRRLVKQGFVDGRGQPLQYAS